MTCENWRKTGTRWLKFNAIGGIGIGVQLLVLSALKTGLHLDYLFATGLAVEAAVVHNFLWHERFTWVDRPSESRLAGFLRFNLSTGLVSIAGNILLMKVLVGIMQMHFFVANGIAIAVCSLFNFAVSDHWVFKSPSDQTG